MQHLLDGLEVPGLKDADGAHGVPVPPHPEHDVVPGRAFLDGHHQEARNVF